MIIESANDWWKLCDSNWPKLLGIFSQLLDMRYPAHTKPGVAITPIMMERGRPLTQLEDIERSKTYRDHERLLKYLNGAYKLAPDNPSIHSIPGWSVLCDLCSEDWVFATDDGNEDNE